MMNHNFKEFNDDILHDDRITRAFKYHRKDLQLKEWENTSKGDFQTMCMAVALLMKIYEKSARANKGLRRSVTFVSDFCLRLPVNCKKFEFLGIPVQIGRIDGTYDVCAIIGYCAVAYVKHVDCYTFRLIALKDSQTMQFVAQNVYNEFDGLRKTVYTDNVVEDIDNNQGKDSGAC